MNKIKYLIISLFILLIYSCAATKGNVNSNKKMLFYSDKLGFELAKGFNDSLVKEVIGWLGAPYQYGGESKTGTDCSGFIQQVYKTVYGINTSRSANDIYQDCIKVKKENLQQGNLVFFKINTEKIGHVGIFLQAPYFIHASSSKGVMVSSLELDYWTKYFVSGGKLKD